MGEITASYTGTANVSTMKISMAGDFDKEGQRLLMGPAAHGKAQAVCYRTACLPLLLKSYLFPFEGTSLR